MTVRINRPKADFDSSSFLSDRVVDILTKVFQASLIPTVLLTAWLMWGLFSGRLADVASMSSADHATALKTITTLSLWLNVSLVVTVVSAGLIYLELEAIGVIYLLAAAFLEPYLAEKRRASWLGMHRKPRCGRSIRWPTSSGFPAYFWL